MSGSTWQLLMPKMRNWVLGACEPDTLYVWISEWYMDAYRRLGVEMSLSALTYFWQLFTNHTVQCRHMGVSFNWVGSQINVFISHRGGIIDGFTCVKTYNQLVQCRFCSWRHRVFPVSGLSSVNALRRGLVMAKSYSFHSPGILTDGQFNSSPGGP